MPAVHLEVKATDSVTAVPSAITLRGISFWYPGGEAPALADLSLEVPSGQLVLLSGASGSGKSTLLRLCLGLVPQFSGGTLAGSVAVLERDPAATPPREMTAGGVALLFQNPEEGFVAQRVEEEVAFGPENLGLPPAEIDRRVAEALAAVGLAGFERRPLRQLSTGQQQRVGLAAALALRPRLLLLDEPAAHLDDATAGTALAYVARIHRDTGCTIIVSEHRVHLAAPLAERVITLDAGAIAGDAATDGAAAASPPPSPPAASRGGCLPSPFPPAGGQGTVRPLPAGGRSLLPQRRAESPRSGRWEGTVPVLQFDGVTFAYAGAAPVLAGVRLELHPGEVVGLVGRSGAGKSTLARLALGLLHPDAGRVALCGVDTRATESSDLARDGGLLLQNPAHQLLGDSVEEELRLGLRGIDAVDAAQRIDEMLGRFGLERFRDRHPLALSEGQRRRVALAAVLARRPRVLILDEPTLGQDPHGRALLLEVVRSLAAQGAAVLAISHDTAFVREACDRVVALRDGQLVAPEEPEHFRVEGTAETEPLLAGGGRRGTPEESRVDGTAGPASTVPAESQLRRSPRPDRNEGASAPFAAVAGRHPPATPSGTRPATTGLHSLDPRVHLVWLLALLALAAAGGDAGLAAAGLVGAGTVVAARAARAWWRTVAAVLPLAAMVVALDALAGQGGAGARVGLRLLALATAGIAFARMADAEAQLAALRWLRVPYAVSFVLVTGARFVPVVGADLATLRDSARLRGIPLDGPLWRQLGGWRRLLVPLLVLTIRRGLQLGEAMEARAFGAAPRRTQRRRLHWRARDTVALAAALALVAAVLAAPRLAAALGAAST